MDIEPTIEQDDERYADGKIYKLQLGNKVYVGSTILKLHERYYCHKSDYKRFIEGKDVLHSASGELFGNNVEPAMGLIEKFPCASNVELCQRERYWQEILSQDINFVVVNKQRAFQSEEERREYYTEKSSKWNEANREHNLERGRKWREANREHHLELGRKRYKANREAIREHQSEKITCEFCNRQSMRGNIRAHQRTAKCKNFQVK